jgi:hypothetical protein
MAGFWSNAFGTLKSAFNIGLTGPRLKDSSGNLVIRNSGDSADANITAAKVSASGNTIELNSDAAGSGADWIYKLTRPASGMTAAVELTLPVDDGTANQVLSTDGNGVLSWASAGSTSSLQARDTTSLAFGTSSPAAMFTLPANAVLDRVSIIIDTAFDGTPTMSVGVSGTASKYVASTEVDLTETAETRFDIMCAKTANGSTEALIITYSAGGATAGAARVIVDYSIPA